MRSASRLAPDPWCFLVCASTESHRIQKVVRTRKYIRDSWRALDSVRRVTGGADDRSGSGELWTLRNWQRGLRINHIAHHRAAARDATLGLALGVTVVVLSTIVGTAIFATLNQSPSTAAKTVAGLFSVAAGVFGALQTFLRFPQRQAAHHEAAVKYGALRREIEAVLGLPHSEQNLGQLLSDLRLRWDEIDAGAPAVSQRIWRVAAGTVAQAEAVAGSERE